MTKILLNDWVQNLNQFDHLIVGFSGGLDSTVLLHALASQPVLFSKISAIHINHGLSANAAVWEKHCQAFCNQLQIPCKIKQVKLACLANIEEEARKARYDIFAAEVKKRDCLILAHHLNDQAETLLLQLFRGAGVEGLAAMINKKTFAEGYLVRPLLTYTRQALESYAFYHKLQWIEDESNDNIFFSRNFLRHQVIPLLQERWPGVVSNLARSSSHCRQAQENLDDLACLDCPELLEPATTLNISAFKSLKPARQSNVLRYWIKSNKIKLPSTETFNRILHEVVNAKRDASPQVNWENISLRRYQQTLYIEVCKSSVYHAMTWNNFPNPIALPYIGVLSAKAENTGLHIPINSNIEIRFRQGGEKLTWHGQTKKLKKLMQEWNIPSWLRNTIPLIFINNELAAVIGHAISDCFYRENKEKIYFQLIINERE